MARNTSDEMRASKNARHRRLYVSDPDYRARHRASQQRYKMKCLAANIALSSTGRARIKIGTWPKAAIVGARRRAKEKGIPFDLKPEDIIVPTHCPILGIPFVFTNTNGFREDSPSLDRIVPELGYIPGNVMVISLAANRIKNNCRNADSLRRLADYMDIAIFASDMRMLSNT